MGNGHEHDEERVSRSPVPAPAVPLAWEIMKRVVGYTIGIVLVVLLLNYFLPPLGRATESALRVKCASNLRQIWQGMMLYHRDHRAWPQSPADLFLNADVNSEVFICRSSDAEVARGPMLQVAQALSDPKHCSYIYLPPPDDAADLPAERVIAVERMENHNGKGMNILYADGHVQWHDAQAAQQIVRELKAGHNPPHRPATQPGGGR